MPDSTEDLRYFSAVIVLPSGEPIEFTHEEGLTAADWVGFAQHQYRSATLRLGGRGVWRPPPSKRRGEPLRAS